MAVAALLEMGEPEPVGVEVVEEGPVFPVPDRAPTTLVTVVMVPLPAAEVYTTTLPLEMGDAIDAVVPVGAKEPIVEKGERPGLPMLASEEAAEVAEDATDANAEVDANATAGDEGDL
jgi:hypothetical protein